MYWISMHRKVLWGSHSPFLKKVISKVVMTRDGPQDNYLRDKNITNTRKYTRQPKKGKKIYNGNLKDTSLKSFLCHKMLGCKKVKLTEKEDL